MSEIVKVLNQVAPSADVRLYSESFENLWELDKLVSVPQDKTYVIVWDDIPHKEKNDVVSTSKYLTPIDWAVAFSLAVHDKAAAEKKEDGKPKSEYPDLRILILDLNSQSVSNADSVRFFKLSPQTMPWVRLYRPLDAEDFINNLRSPDAVSSMKDEIEKTDMGLIRNVWAAFLTKPSTPGDHHAIANLVGPLLLMGEDEKPDQHTKALRSLMKALGLIPQQSKGELLSKGKPWIPWDDPKWAERLSRLTKDGGKLNLILIDDQWKTGWGEVLCKAVGAEYKESASSASSAMLEIGRSKDDKVIIKAAASAVDLLSLLDGTDKRFNFNICSDPAKDAEILFLDLRLFSGEGEDKKEQERTFFKGLVEIAEKFIGRQDLPWPGFDSKKLKDVKEWCESKGKRETEPYVEALTLLPRILSLTDMSLPIVIFSSTGRRDIAEKLKWYGNIITDFDKPKFTVDMPEDVAEQTKRKLKTALGKTFQILKARQKCKTIIARGNEISKTLSAVQAIQTQANNIYIELFVDESRDDINNKFSVGGCFSVFVDKTLSKAEDCADQFEDNLVKKGIRYFDAFGIGPIPSKIKNKKTACISELSSAVSEQNSSKPLLLGAVRLTNDPYRPIDAESDLLYPNSIDNHYRLTLNALLELFLFETIPAIRIATATANAKVDVSLYIGTRGKFVKAHLLHKIKKDRYRFGVGAIETNKGDFIQFSMSQDSIYPILIDAFSSHEKSISIYRALGIQLPYKKEHIEYPEYVVCRKCKGTVNIKKDIINGKLTKQPTCPTCNLSSDFRPDYRALHYVADELLSNFPSKNASSIYDSVFPATLIMPGQFDDTLNEELYRALLASRALDRGDYVAAVSYLLVPEPIKENSMPTVKEWLTMRVAPVLKHIDGGDFFGIVDRLSETDSIQYYSAVIQKKQSKKNMNDFYYVGLLQEGPDKGENAFIPPKLYGLRKPVDGEVLKIQYLKDSKGLKAQRLAL